MQIKINKTKIEDVKTQLLAIGCFEDRESQEAKKFDKQLNNAIEKAVQQKEFNGDFLQTKLLTTLGKLQFERLLLVGLGKQKDFDLEKLRKVSATVALAAKEQGAKQYATNLHTLQLNATLAEKVQAIAESAILALYQFVEYKTVDKEKIKFVDLLEIVETANAKQAEDAVKQAVIVANATCLVRDLVNQPASYMNPIKMAEIAKTLPKQIKATIYDKKAIQKLGMNALLAVNKGSAIEPRWIVLEYHANKERPTVLVGKGITFDSGGLDIKPEAGMETMKMDMAGAATVLATFKAAAELQLPLNLVGILPCTENMPGGDAYKQGDVIKTYCGKTIEVINTDAEGRVILADAISYAEKFKPSRIIDLATLTGACVVALGNEIAGAFGNDKKLIHDLFSAGEKTGERIWELPLYEEFKESVKSEIADVRNLSTLGRDAGAITGAAFLNAFVEKTPWAHLDIAGPAWAKEDKAYLRKGGTGFGVRLLINFLSQKA